MPDNSNLAHYVSVSMKMSITQNIGSTWRYMLQLHKSHAELQMIF